MDGQLAPALQGALHRFAKPWNRLRAMRVFRDQTTLSANPNLWSSIEQALQASEFFLLLASPESAASHWVQQEIEFWCRNKPVSKFLILLTDGEVTWNDENRDFDWNATTALSTSLTGVFEAEPLYIDLRWARESEHLSLGHPRFRDAVGDLAATLQGRDKDELLGEDVRQHRRVRRLTRAVIVALTVLVLAAAGGALLAVDQRDQARDQARLATSRGLAASALDTMDRDFNLAVLLAAKAHQVQDTPQARSALLATLEHNPQHVAFLHNGAGSVVTAASWSPDGATIAIGTVDGRITLRDAGDASRRGKELTPRAKSPVTQVAFSDDRRMLAVGTHDGTILVWDAPSGQQRPGPPPARKRISALRFSPTGTVLGWGDDSGMGGIWHLTSQAEIARTHGGANITHVFFEAGDRTVDLVHIDGQLTRLDMQSGGKLPIQSGQFIVPLQTFHSTYAEDGSLLATANYSSYILLWERGALDAKAGGWQAPGSIDRMSFSPDKKVLAIAGGGIVQLWDVATERLRETLTGYPERVLALEFSPDGRRLAASTGATLVVSDLERVHRLGRVLSAPHSVATVSRGVAGVAFSPDGRTLSWDDPVESGRRSIVEWEVGSEREPVRQAPRSGDDFVFRRKEVPKPPGDEWTTAARSHDGHLEAYGRTDGSVVIRDLRSGRERKPMPFAPTTEAPSVVALAMSADGKLLAAASADRVRLWDTVRGHELGTLPTGQRSQIALTPDGRTLAAISVDGVTTVFDVPTRQRLAALRQAVLEPFNADIAFSPDGEYLVTAVSGAGVMIWDMSPTSWREHACVLGGRELSVVEKSQFVGKAFGDPVCGED